MEEAWEKRGWGDIGRMVEWEEERKERKRKREGGDLPCPSEGSSPPGSWERTQDGFLGVGTLVPHPRPHL